MEDRLGSVDLRKVKSYPSLKFLEYLAEEIKNISDRREFERLFNNAIKYTLVHLSFSGRVDLVKEFLEKVNENYISQEFGIDTEFVLDDFADLELSLRGIENYEYVKIVPVIGEKEIGKFELNESFRVPILPIQVKCIYKGKEISKVFKSSECKEFDFSLEENGRVENVDELLEESSRHKSEEFEGIGGKEKGNTDKVYVCENCGNEFLSKTKLEEHLKARKTVEQRKINSSEESRSEESKNESNRTPSNIVNRKNFAIVTFILILSLFIYPFGDDSLKNSPIENLSETNSTKKVDKPPVEELTESDLEKSLYTDINNIREQRNLSNISRSSKLGSIAKSHAESIAKRENITHYSKSGLNVSERYRNSGYLCSNFDISENFNGAENILKIDYGVFNTDEDTMFINTSEELSKTVAEKLMVENTGNYASTPEINLQGIGTEVTELGNNSKTVYIVQDLC